MKKHLLLIFAFCFTSVAVLAQTQLVRGTVTDKETRQPLKDADIRITTPGIELAGVITAEDGSFTLAGVPVGRQDFSITLKGYKAISLPNIVVTSGKEVVLQIEMEEELLSIGTVDITVKGKSGQPNNENALVSARLFTVDETDRFAGSRGDPARMASNFAGVQGADDSRNDIVVRGNSPGGILWRLEGIDIPNPNHFSIPGTTGGPVSIINNKILANSDFFTGAFPSEYGNSIAGVFDLKLRNGSSKRMELSSQLGFLGWDVMAEGPFSKKSKASYLFAYRYSTLAMFSALKIPIGTDAVPNYQDLSFKLNFPMGKKANLSFFGIGGTSQINILISQQKESTRNLYGDNDRDQKFGSAMGVVGTKFNYNFGKKSYLQISAAYSSQTVKANHTLVFRQITDTVVRDGESFYQYKLDSMVPNLDYNFRTATLGFNAFVNTKLSARTSMRYGLQATRYDFGFQDSNRNFDSSNKSAYWKWFTRWNSNGQGLLLMPYWHIKYRLGSKTTITAGVTTSVFSIRSKPLYGNNAAFGETSVSFGGVQPRAGLRYQANRNHAFNLGMGAHAQIQSPYTYFYIMPGNSTPHNQGMGMTRSKHFVAGWDWQVKKDLRTKVETYYQQLSNIPVERKISSFSLANTGSGFSRFFPDTLTNTGAGYNYGIEFTAEKFFTKGYYYLTTFSLFDARYRGSDMVWRSTDFNTRYAFNALFAKEWTFKKRNSLNLGGKITLAGARLTSPMDTLQSIREREYVGVDAQKNSISFGSNYARFDLRIAYRINGKKVSHELAIDLVNVTNRQNILKYSFINEPPYSKQEYQLGFLPLFYYKIDFGR